MDGVVSWTKNPALQHDSSHHWDALALSTVMVMMVMMVMMMMKGDLPNSNTVFKIYELVPIGSGI